MNKEKKTLSGPAVFMYTSIALMAVFAALFLSLYYSGIWKHDLILWIGIVSFMILYHFGLRILFGEWTKRLPIRYSHPFFQHRAFEKALYRTLRVRFWKDRVLTFDPDSYNFQKRTLEELAQTMAKSETDHWINEGISLFSLFFSLIWGHFPIFLITCILAMLFDLQFILVQRYNRPIVLRLLENKRKKQEKNTI